MRVNASIVETKPKKLNINVILGDTMHKSLLVALLTATIVFGFGLVNILHFGIVHASIENSGILKPYVPEFTVELIDLSYDVPTTYSTDPYTGETITHPGHRVTNKTIELTIRNQPFDYSANDVTYHLFYNVRIKPHFEENWNELYPLVERHNSSYNSFSWPYSLYVSDSAPCESNSEFIILSLSAYYSPNAQVDFQVEAIIGHDSQFWYIEHVLAPMYGGYYKPAIAYDTTSGWSNTQTLTISESQTPTSSPEPTPSQEPQQTDHTTIIVGVAIIVAVLGAGLGFLFYLIKRK